MTMRVTPAKGFTTMEKLVVALVARGDNYTIISKRLHIAPSTVKFHALNASEKLPGDLPPQMRIVFWFRGATRDQLSESGFPSW